MKKFLSLLVCTSFVLNSLMPPAYAQALMGKDLGPLPKPGSMVALSSPVNPPVLRGIKVYTNDPFKFDFILDPGDKDRKAVVNGKLSSKIQAELKETSNRLLKYFLTTLTVPDNDIWVNLSPYEKDRVISKNFGQTEMGRDLLGQDYLLKQITASLMFPQGEAGKKFWARVYEEAQKKFGSTQIPINTFNKVWVMPEKAVIYEKLSGNQATAFVIESRLKVMLESDYIATQKHGEAAAVGAVQDKPLTDTQKLSRDVAREVIIPILEKEINEGQNFAPLRQVYNSILLALWYKDRMKGSILSSAYVNRSKIAGVNVQDKAVARKIWQRYVQAYKKGAFNLISEERNPVTSEIIPRKYFAGGFNIDNAQLTTEYVNESTISKGGVERRSVLKMLTAVAGLPLVEVLAGCNVATAFSGVWDFPHISSITLESNGWKFTVSAAPGGGLTVDINYQTPLQQDTKYTLYPNGSIVFPDNGTNTTYMYNTAQGQNILSNVIDILNFVLSLSPGSGSQLNGVIKTIQDSLFQPFAKLPITKILDGEPTQEIYTLAPVTDSNGVVVNLLLSDQIPDQTLGLGIPDETGTDNINLTTQEVTSYISDTYPFSETFQPNTNEWANVLYWILQDLNNALTTGQNQLSPGQITQMQKWYDTINRWYKTYFGIQVKNGKSVDAFANNPKSLRPLDLHRKALVGRVAQPKAADSAMNGGIDLRKNSTPLDVRNNKGGVINFNIDPAQIERIIMAPGLTPQVFSIDPLQSLPAFLGMSKEEAQQMAA